MCSSVEGPTTPEGTQGSALVFLMGGGHGGGRVCFPLAVHAFTNPAVKGFHRCPR